MLIRIAYATSGGGKSGNTGSKAVKKGGKVKAKPGSITGTSALRTSRGKANTSPKVTSRKKVKARPQSIG